MTARAAAGLAEARAAALTRFDDPSGYLAQLARLVAIPTESQNPARAGDLARYLAEGVGPIFAALGYACRVFENPDGGPILLASREEGAPVTLLSYGHGDVILGQEGAWSGGRDPWSLQIEGDRAYGRGVADNKGQHLAHLTALAAVLATRGQLGFNHRFIIEMGEENGSRGFRPLVQADPAPFRADAFFASDGPRTEMGRPNITLGNRGVVNFDLVCALRAGGHHSGNWGGLLANPAIILANALASICDGQGRILLPDWQAQPVPASVRAALDGVSRDAGATGPAVDPAWGAPGLSAMEKVTASNSFEVLAFAAGTPDRPVNAIPPSARAACQLRYVTGTDPATLLPALRRHLDAAGFHRVAIAAPDRANAIAFEATRTDPGHPWAVWIRDRVASVSGSCSVLPNSGGSNVTEVMQHDLDMPTVWLPLSYAGCNQHAPDEHILLPLMREGLEIVTAIYWALGETTAGGQPAARDGGRV
ncbi:MAG: M20/M25/M40 family metallo-hydrolase [Pseudomonadota bacterium]